MEDLTLDFAPGVKLVWCVSGGGWVGRGGEGGVLFFEHLAGRERVGQRVSWCRCVIGTLCLDVFM